MRNLDLLAHLLQFVFVLVVAHAAGDDAHHGLGDLHGRPVAQLPEVLVIDQGGDVDKVELRQQVQQGISDVENGNLATGTGIQPLCCYIYRHLSALL